MAGHWPPRMRGRVAAEGAGSKLLHCRLTGHIACDTLTPRRGSLLAALLLDLPRLVASSGTSPKEKRGFLCAAGEFVKESRYVALCSSRLIRDFKYHHSQCPPPRCFLVSSSQGPANSSAPTWRRSMIISSSSTSSGSLRTTTLGNPSVHERARCLDRLHLVILGASLTEGKPASVVISED